MYLFDMRVLILQNKIGFNKYKLETTQKLFIYYNYTLVTYTYVHYTDKVIAILWKLNYIIEKIAKRLHSLI
jgi:hypothetical protein